MNRHFSFYLKWTVDCCILTPLARHEVVGGRRQVDGEGDREGRPQHPAPRARGLQLVCPDITSECRHIHQLLLNQNLLQQLGLLQDLQLNSLKLSLLF